MAEHIVYLYDEDIKKIIAKHYNIKLENIEEHYYYDIENVKTRICYQIIFPQGE